MTDELNLSTSASNSTVSNEQMAENISRAESFVPIADDLDSIKEAWKSAHSYAFQPDESEDDLSDEIKNDSEKLAKWREQNQSTSEYKKMLRDKFESMSEQEFRDWAAEANSQFGATVGLLKRELSANNPLLLSPEERKRFEEQRKLDELTAMGDSNSRFAKEKARCERRRFLKITNPKRKRGNPIDKEPEEFREFLRECRHVRSYINFDRMGRLELKTRLIQEMAGTRLYQRRVENKIVHENTLTRRLANIIDMILHVYPDILSNECITKMLANTGLFEFPKECDHEHQNAEKTEEQSTSAV